MRAVSILVTNPEGTLHWQDDAPIHVSSLLTLLELMTGKYGQHLWVQNIVYHVCQLDGEPPPRDASAAVHERSLRTRTSSIPSARCTAHAMQVASRGARILERAKWLTVRDSLSSRWLEAVGV